MTNVCFYISVTILLLTIGFVVWLANTKKAVKKHFKKILIFALGAFLATAVLYFPTYYYGYEGDIFVIFNAILNTLLQVVSVFSVDPGVLDYASTFINISKGVYPYFLTYLVILHVLCPIFTIGIILSLFKNLSAKISYLFKFFKDVYIFSELNEKSLALAKDIKKNNNRRTIIFCGVKEENEQGDIEVFENLLELSAICFSKEIQNINFKIHSRAKNIYFYTISEDKIKNTNQALHIIKEYGEIEKTNLYIFSDNIESELLLASNANKKIKIRRLNEALSLINNQLYYEGVKLFKSAKQVGDEKQISAIVVGMGGYGLEMLKSLVWYCQMDGYSLKINAFDKNFSAESQFASACPEIISEDYNGKYIPGEPYYDIRIHSGMQTETVEFANAINKISDATYVFVSLGCDSKNIKTSVWLRTLFERMGIKPIIQTVVYNSEIANHLVGITNFKNQSYDIEFIGDLDSLFTEAIFMNSILENKALERHLKWGKEEDFWRYEYNYRSSVASAIHYKARIDCGIPGAEKAQKDITEQEMDKIANLEHRRWNAYMRSQGYVFNEKRNDLGKMHHDLIKFSDLTEEDIDKDKNVGTK